MAIDRETQVLTAAYAGGIRSPRELANFMAQVGHESNGLNRLDESFRYMRGTAQIPVQAAWREGPKALDAARREALLGQPEKLAELMYGGRHGNDDPGDGFRYHGRGYLPVPGKNHYRAAGHALGLDLVGQPALAAEPEHAARIAVWYWRNRVPQEAREDVKGATQALNGRLYGLDDRRARFDAWEKRLTPELMERLSDGGLGHPAEAMSMPHATEYSLRSAARKRSKDDLTSASLVENAELPDDGDPLLMYEQQRDVMEATTEVIIPEPRGRHRHHHPHPSSYAPPLQHAAHPQHTLFVQARDAVHTLDQAHHRRPDDRSDNLAAALVVEAHKQGMTRIDHVTLSEDASRAYAVQGDLDSPHKRIADVRVDQATHTPLAQSAEALASHAAKAANEPMQTPPAIKPTPGH